jgi:hypothetical protein
LIEALKSGRPNISTVGPKRAENLKVLHESMFEKNKVMKRLRENLMRRYNIDVWDSKKFPVRESNFSWGKLQDKLDLREADSSTTFAQFLRAGVQNVTASAYESVKTTFEDWVTVVSSNKDTELFAPNHGVSFPREVGPNMKYPEVAAAALDIKLKNRKHGSVYAVEWELYEDDTTGSFSRQAAQMGEYMKLLAEVRCYGKLVGDVSNLKYSNYKIRLSETKPSNETNYPWSTALQGGGQNRPSAYGTLSKANIQSAMIASQQQVNLQGIIMQVELDRFLIGPHWQFDLAILMNSAFYPSGAETAGVTGGAFGINPLKGLADVSVTRFMPDQLGSWVDSKAWYLIDSKKPCFINQVREGMTIVQENAQSGASFENDVLRFKARNRENSDWLDPRFGWRGSDGSV